MASVAMEHQEDTPASFLSQKLAGREKRGPSDTAAPLLEAKKPKLVNSVSASDGSGFASFVTPQTIQREEDVFPGAAGCIFNGTGAVGGSMWGQSDWEEWPGPGGRLFYYNRRTEDSVWEKPPSLIVPQTQAATNPVADATSDSHARTTQLDATQPAGG